MNEGLALYLDLDRNELEENEKFIQRIDRLLLQYGIKYSGIMNLYLPVNPKDRDHAVFTACKVLRETDWLKGILSHILMAHQIRVCSLDKILTDYMAEPGKKKFQYYEDYYRESGHLAHGIIIDENRQLRDGYISYLLALRYGIDTDVCEAFSNQPTRKLVCGRHVRFDENEWKFISDKSYRWVYTLKKPVVPGDILQVRTKYGLAYMCVERIEYVTGREFCREYSKVKRHLGIRMGQ